MKFPEIYKDAPPAKTTNSSGDQAWNSLFLSSDWWLPCHHRAKIVQPKKGRRDYMNRGSPVGRESRQSDVHSEHAPVTGTVCCAVQRLFKHMWQAVSTEIRCLYLYLIHLLFEASAFFKTQVRWQMVIILQLLLNMTWHCPYVCLSTHTCHYTRSLSIVSTYSRLWGVLWPCSHWDDSFGKYIFNNLSLNFPEL